MKNVMRDSLIPMAAVAMTVLSPAIALASPDGEVGGLFSTGVLVEVGLLILVSGCALTAFKVYNSVRGGRIAQGWQWFLMGFIVFSVAQVLSVGSQAAIIPISSLWVGLIRIGALAIIFLGAIRMRRLLA